jgi:hypothetical protein
MRIRFLLTLAILLAWGAHAAGAGAQVPPRTVETIPYLGPREESPFAPSPMGFDATVAGSVASDQGPPRLVHGVDGPC